MKRFAFLTLLLLSLTAVKAQYRVDRLITAGRSALYYDDFVLSIKYFNLAISAKPYLYEPWYYRSIAKYNLDDFQGAENDATEAIGLNPYINDIYDLRAICKIRQERYDEAVTDYDEAIRLEPRNQNYWYNRALCLMQGGHYDSAQVQLDTIVTKWVKFANAYSLKAEVYLRQKDTLSAEKWLDKSLEIDPYDADAWGTRAAMALSRKEWGDADNALGKAIHLRPNNVNNYLNRALARINLNNLRGAMADYDMALDLDPNNFLGHYNRGLLRMQLGDDNRAITDFDFVIKMEPENFLALFNRGVLHDKTGNLRAAIADYSKVIAQFPNFWTGLSYRANCYRRLGMTAKAEADEFRIFKAQMDKHIGIQPRWTASMKKMVRKRSEIDIDKYNNLIVEDDDNIKSEHEYKSEYRGRIQNRAVQLDYMPMYQLSYFQTQTGISAAHVFDKEVEEFNAKVEKNPFFIVCNRERLDENTSSAIFALIDKCSAQLSVVKDDESKKRLLMQRGVAYAVLRDFQAAMSDFTDYLHIDGQASMPYWMRAVCQVEMDAFFKSQGGSSTSLASPEADFSEAIKLNPNNAYLYYNRGNMHVARNEYSKAIDDYTIALNLDPNLAEAYYNRGIVRITTKNTDKAISDLSKAGELGLYDAYSIIKRVSRQK